MRDALAAGRPASLKLRKHERLAFQIGDYDRSERGLSGQFKADANDSLDVFWRQPQIASGLLQLVAQPFDLFVNLLLEFEHSADGSGILLRFGRIECGAFTEHRLLDLGGNDGANLAQIFADVLHLDGRAHQKLQVATEIAWAS